jgi:hypothetical protein
VRTIIHYTDYKRFHVNVTIKYNGEDIPTETDSKPKDAPKQ